MSLNGENSPANTGTTPPAEDTGHLADPATVRETPLAGGADLLQDSGMRPETREDPKGVPGLLELIYGILFDPVGTFRRTAQSPPLGRSIVIFSLVKILSVLVGGYLSSRYMFGSIPGFEDLGLDQAVKFLVPIVAVIMLIYEYIKWFVYSCILYLLAELFGGRGRAAGALTVTGLAALPALLFLPVQVLVAVFGGMAISGPVNILIWLAVMIWGAVLVVTGLRETQHISTGRAVMVALTPVLSLIFIFIIIIMILAGMVAPLAHLLK